MGGYELNFEYGYRVYNKLVSMISEHSQAIIIFNGILIMILLGMLIKGYSPYVFLSIWLYVTLGVYQTQMNMARNAIAIFICYNGIKYIENRDLKKYLICICIATTFHVSSVLFIPVYWLAAIRLTDKKIWVIIVFLCSVGFLFSLIRQIIVQFLPFGFGRYFIGNTTKFESLVVGAFHLMLVLFVFFFTERQKRADIFETEAVGIWMLIIEILFFCIGYDVASAARMAALFGPYLIVFVPRLIETGIGSKDERLNVIAMVAILSGIQYIVRLQMNNIGATIPYRFFGS